MFSMPSIPKESPVTLTLLVINIILFAGQSLPDGIIPNSIFTGNSLTSMGVLYGPAVQDGQIWRILSSGFLHGGIVHVGFNMYLLFMLGPQMEQGFGSLRFCLMYFGSLFGGALAVLLFDFSQPTLGASGAVLGLAGAMFVALWARGVNPRQSPVFGLVVLNLALPLLVPGISFWGHFGGVAAGAALATVLVWLPEKNRASKSANSLSHGVALTVLLAALCLGVPQLMVT